jgi:hypothetical protein
MAFSQLTSYRWFALLLLCLSVLPAWSQPLQSESELLQSVSEDWRDDYEIIKDLGREWITVDDENHYVPFIDEGMAEVPVAGILLDLARYGGNELLICMPGNSSVLIEQQIVAYRIDESCLSLPVDELRGDYDKDRLLVSVYQPDRDFEEIGFWVVRAKSSLAGQKVNASLRRADSPLADFFTLGLMIILLFYAILVHQYPRVSRNLYSLGQAFSTKVREEQGRVRLINEAHLMFLIQHCLLLAYLLIMLYALTDTIRIELPFINLEPATFGGYMLLWAQMALLVFGTIWLKYIIIMIFGSMFGLRQLRYLHMLDYMRISLIYSAFLFALLIITFAGIGMYQTGYFRGLVYVFLVLSAIRVIVLYVRLFSRGSFRNVYLFSYICIAEIVPLLVGIELLII